MARASTRRSRRRRSSAARPAPRSWACGRWPRCSSPTSSRAAGTTSSPSPRSSAGAPGTPVPITLRLPSGGGFSGGPFHSQNPESSFAHIPGLKCVCPATPEDAKGLIVSAIEDPNPVLFFEHKHLYRRIKGEVPDERYTTPIGEARIHREGEDVTRRHLGRDGLHGRRGRGRAGRRLGRDRRPALDPAVGQGGRARVGAQDVEGARAARGHAHRRLRRRDRGDDRRGGLRGSRRAAAADHRARHARPVLARARAGVHPAGRRRRRRDSASWSEY